MGEATADQALRIFLWIVPRVNSTAFTKLMGYVDDTVVWMEPYWTCHLNKTFYNPEFKKGEAVAEKMRAKLQKLTQDEEAVKAFKPIMERAAKLPNLSAQEKFTHKWVKKQLEAPEPGKKCVFIKDQAFAIKDHLDCLPENVPIKHAFLIRHPREVYTSFHDLTRKVLDPFKPIPWDECRVAEDCCYMPVPEFYQIQYKLWKHIKENLDPDVIIVDSYDLTSRPGVILPKLFEKWDIPFKKSYLEWAADPEAVFASWRGSPPVVVGAALGPATSRAINSTKLEAPANPRGVSRKEWKITDDLNEYIEGAMPFYEEMYAARFL